MGPFKKLQDFTRRVLAVPKKEIDEKIAEEKKSRYAAKRGTRGTK